jgi:hypothetical protein
MLDFPYALMIVVLAGMALVSGCVSNPPQPMGAPVDVSEARRPGGDADLRFWLENMVWHHRFAPQEIRAATGLSEGELEAAMRRFNIRYDNAPARAADAPILVMPYPGGRHPRIGFLDGAVNPQRETKISVFLPWDEGSYVVVDVPEAIWSNLGLTYLAHTHIPTLWTEKGIEMEKLEWSRGPGGTLEQERRLPNGIVFGTKVRPTREAVWMELWLTNGTDEPLTGLRVQICCMLKAAKGFDAQTGDNKVLAAPYVAVGSEDRTRWIITAWEPCERPWQNPPCPCMHSDPKFPDCPPGETQRIRGFISIYNGSDAPAEFRRFEGTGWRDGGEF